MKQKSTIRITVDVDHLTLSTITNMTFHEDNKSLPLCVEKEFEKIIQECSTLREKISGLLLGNPCTFWLALLYTTFKYIKDSHLSFLLIFAEYVTCSMTFFF